MNKKQTQIQTKDGGYQKGRRMGRRQEGKGGEVYGDGDQTRWGAHKRAYRCRVVKLYT